MGAFDDLLSSVTDDDGIRADFLEAVRTAYDDDMNVHLTRIGELEGEIGSMSEAHAQEISAIKNDRYDKLMSADASADTEEIVNDNDPDDYDGPIYMEEED